MKSRYKIVDPIRFFIFIFICVMTVTIAALTLVNMSSAEAASVNTYKQVVVEEQGTLWNIADTYCNNNMDIRDYIDQICDINDISSSDFLQAGDILFVPIYS